MRDVSLSAKLLFIHKPPHPLDLISMSGTSSPCYKFDLYLSNRAILKYPRDMHHLKSISVVTFQKIGSLHLC